VGPLIADKPIPAPLPLPGVFEVIKRIPGIDIFNYITFIILKNNKRILKITPSSIS
jgi:hypothetical protein